ncbi:patatin-like phospholipase family protein [Atopomonas sediminilitoris]|uniref:patatin-like phospholipase family protein n=1 Tax=Atopomonas sediminilitoris TaxID=2919919 RepID=UPI001F4F10A4|nr:patatin-like phospholipase family protein [Atopomonas sediminilitoris]MCJ8168180.1 patatin-like phospholipase family protein [Atopomonas sediminilitoris]
MQRIKQVCVGALALLLGACSSLPRHQAVPTHLTQAASIPGLEGVRYHVGLDDKSLQAEGLASFKREQQWLMTQGVKALPPVNFLAISGGGDDGAFTAGLLNGWSQAGDRPEFKLVTGVSTGALIAPFAFLGSAYDDTLKNLYTNVEPKDILAPRSLWAAVTSDAMADNSPLYAQLKKTVNAEMMTAIAAEYAKGRLLFVATADLDARQSVLWNMSKIAAAGTPQSLELFRSIMLASAAIPGAFPPVMIDVEADGKNYQEMHVDGGTMSQVFVYPPSLQVAKLSQANQVQRERNLYVIRNARLDAQWAQVERRTMDIAARAVSSLIQTQGVGDLYRIYLTAQRDGFNFKLAFIPPEFNAEHREDFDQTYMRALYQLGHQRAQQGYPWALTPPGY